jgi:hypothetical protein
MPILEQDPTNLEERVLINENRVFRPLSLDDIITWYLPCGAINYPTHTQQFLQGTLEKSKYEVTF